MGDSRRRDGDGDDSDVRPDRGDLADGAAMTVSRQQLRLGTEWFVSGRVRLRRRIVTETRTVEVTVRREVLEVHGEDVDLHDGHLVGTATRGPALDRAPEPTAPLVLTLREEVPVVDLRVRPYDRVTVTTARVDATETVHETLAGEQVDVVVEPPLTS